MTSMHGSRRFLLTLLLATALSSNAQSPVADDPPPYADPPDTVQVDTVTSPPSDSLSVIKRSYDFRSQIGLALGMMAFIAIVLTSVQTLNPR